MSPVTPREAGCWRAATSPWDGLKPCPLWLHLVAKPGAARLNKEPHSCSHWFDHSWAWLLLEQLSSLWELDTLTQSQSRVVSHGGGLSLCQPVRCIRSRELWRKTWEWECAYLCVLTCGTWSEVPFSSWLDHWPVEHGQNVRSLIVWLLPVDSPMDWGHACLNWPVGWRFTLEENTCWKETLCLTFTRTFLIWTTSTKMPFLFIIEV